MHATVISFVCLGALGVLAQSPHSGTPAIETAAAAGTPLVEVRGAQFLRARVLVDKKLTIRGSGATTIDCQGLPTAFHVR